MKRMFQIVAVTLALGFSLSGCGNDPLQTTGAGGKKGAMDMQERPTGPTTCSTPC